MASDTFWTTQGLTPARSLFQQTPGDLQGNPAGLLRGIAPDGARSAALATADQTIFPRFDGVTNLVPRRPADFAAPTPDSFARWHGFHQVEYLRTHGTATTVTDGADTFTVYTATLGTQSDPFFNLQAVLAQDGTQVIILNTLSAADLAGLPLADQRALAANPIFREHFAGPLGLTPNTAITSTQAARDQMRTEILNRIAIIQNAPSYDPGRQADFDADPAARPGLYHYLFTGQLQILSDRLASMGIFHPDTIKAEADAILTRFARLERYMGLTPEGTMVLQTLPTGVNATDQGASIRSAQSILAGIEMRLFDLATASRSVALTGIYEGKRVDTPDMVFLFQTFETYANEAEAEARSEDLKQLNALLSDYTMMQRLLNTTLQSYDPVALADPDTVERKGLLGETSTTAAAFTALNRRVLAMFDTLLTGAQSPNSGHPIETELALTRPTESIILFGSTLQEHPKPIWDAFARNLAEATKILNQDTQIRMDEIAELNRTKNRSYDLASNTLNRMADILRSVIN